jgi:predicted metal-dependent enzyme (double-stranded beta helix superfamily)
MNAMLGAMIEAVTAAVATGEARRHAAIAEALAPFLGKQDLLAGTPCPCSPARYVRHLLHEDMANGWAMVALAWMPGQASPVHGHRTWCALGVHQGWLEERYFSLARGLPVLGTRVPRAVGSTSAGPADITLIHQLANVSAEPALSIHVYGVAYDGMGDGVNHVYAAA